MKKKKHTLHGLPLLPEWNEGMNLEPTAEEFYLKGEKIEDKIVKIRYKKVDRNYGIPRFIKRQDVTRTPKISTPLPS